MAGTRPKILVVEDNKETQLIIKVALRDRFELHLVTNASDAIASLSNQIFNLVLLDLNLEGKNEGKNILKVIREEMKNSELPVVITTAYDLKPDDEKFFQKNANGFVPKPFDKKVLLDILNNILSQ